jgi:hypothetical protein
LVTPDRDAHNEHRERAKEEGGAEDSSDANVTGGARAGQSDATISTTGIMAGGPWMTHRQFLCQPDPL